MKEVVNQIRSAVSFCGFEIESISPKKLYVALDLKSRSKFRKKNFHMAVSKSLNGILTAERDLSRSYKKNVIIFDPVNCLPEPTFGNVEIIHDLDSLQKFLNK